MEKRFLEIQQAHMAQQVYVQKLQDKLSQIPRFKSAIKIQEQIIHRLESVLENNNNTVNNLQSETIKNETNKVNEDRMEGQKTNFLDSNSTTHQILLLEKENQELKNQILHLKMSLNGSKNEEINEQTDALLLDFRTELEMERQK